MRVKHSCSVSDLPWRVVALLQPISCTNCVITNKFHIQLLWKKHQRNCNIWWYTHCSHLCYCCHLPFVFVEFEEWKHFLKRKGYLHFRRDPKRHYMTKRFYIITVIVVDTLGPRVKGSVTVKARELVN